MALTSTGNSTKTSPLIKITPQNFLEDAGGEENFVKTKTVGASRETKFCAGSQAS